MPTHAAAAIARTPFRVVLAEDDAPLRALLALALRKDGHDVVEAGDGRELLEHLTAAISAEGTLRDIDVIVSDIGMPVLTALRRPRPAAPERGKDAGHPDHGVFRRGNAARS